MDLPPVVYIEWLDAITEADNGWKSRALIVAQKPAVIHTVGFLLADEPTHYTVAGTLADDEVGGDVTIPKGMITKYEVIG